jgi:hypothetical protein
VDYTARTASGVLLTFSALTIITFVVLTVARKAISRQVKDEWLENPGTLVTRFVLAVIVGVVFGDR